VGGRGTRDRLDDHEPQPVHRRADDDADHARLVVVPALAGHQGDVGGGDQPRVRIAEFGQHAVERRDARLVRAVGRPAQRSTSAARADGSNWLGWIGAVPP
jgi:hypothetical protein